MASEVRDWRLGAVWVMGQTTHILPSGIIKSLKGLEGARRGGHNNFVIKMKHEIQITKAA